MDNYMNNQPRELDWDSEISSEEIERPRLSAGDYPFQIVSLEKQRHDPKETHPIPPCNKAYLTVRVTDRVNGISVDIHHSLYLHSSRKWQLCEFFAAIGLLQKDESLKMDWNRVVGATGICKIKPWEKNGRTYSGIDRFYPAYDLPQGYQQPAQAYAAPVAPVVYGQPQPGYAAPQQPQQGGFTPGRF